MAEMFGQHANMIARLDGDEAEGRSGEDELPGNDGAAEYLQVAFEPGEGSRGPARDARSRPLLD